jgi:hypothetical protein
VDTPKSSKKANTWTDEQIKLLCDLKESGLPWPYSLSYHVDDSEIAEHFPGRTLKTVQNVWSSKRKAATETFTPEKVREDDDVDSRMRS